MAVIHAAHVRENRCNCSNLYHCGLSVSLRQIGCSRFTFTEEGRGAGEYTFLKNSVFAVDFGAILAFCPLHFRCLCSHSQGEQPIVPRICLFAAPGSKASIGNERYALKRRGFPRRWETCNPGYFPSFRFGAPGSRFQVDMSRVLKNVPYSYQSIFQYQHFRDTFLPPLDCQ